MSEQEYWERASDPVTWPYYVLGGFIILIIFSLLISTIQSITDRLSSDLRTLNAAQLWVSIIPVFGSFWIFYVIYQLANSLREEFRRRKIIEFETSPGLGIGWAFSFFSLTAQLLLTIDEPVVTVLLAILSVILLAVYWARILSFRSKLDEDIARSFTPPAPSHHNYHPPFYPPPPSAGPPPDYPPQSPDEQWDRWRPK